MNVPNTENSDLMRYVRLTLPKLLTLLMQKASSLIIDELRCPNNLKLFQQPEKPQHANDRWEESRQIYSRTLLKAPRIRETRLVSKSPFFHMDYLSLHDEHNIFAVFFPNVDDDIHVFTLEN